MAKLTREDVERIVKEAGEKGEQPNFKGAKLARVNLSGANLFRANLSEADLQEAYLGGANLNGANLSNAVLTEANFSGTILVRADLKDSDLFRANLSEANLNGADLEEAYLSGAYLGGARLRGTNLRATHFGRADLSEADLRGANLKRAYLREAKLERANLSEADLSEAILNGANLRTTNLSWTNLTDANFNKVILRWTDFTKAILDGTDFSEATIGDTIFVNVDLGGVKGLETVIHKAPSIIDINTIHKSGDKIPKVFLEQAGVHPDIIRWQHSLHTRPTVFISYNHKDEAEKDHLLTHLHALQRNDLIDIWHDQRITGGADWKAEIKQAIARASVVILLVSPNFLASDFIFDEEIPAFLERQRSDKKLHLYPIIAKPCSWQAADWLAKVQVRPKGGQPIWGKDSDTDTELAQITNEITEIIKDLMFK